MARDARITWYAKLHESPGDEHEHPCVYIKRPVVPSAQSTHLSLRGGERKGTEDSVGVATQYQAPGAAIVQNHVNGVLCEIGTVVTGLTNY